MKRAFTDRTGAGVPWRIAPGLTAGLTDADETDEAPDGGGPTGIRHRASATRATTDADQLDTHGARRKATAVRPTRAYAVDTNVAVGEATAQSPQQTDEAEPTSVDGKTVDDPRHHDFELARPQTAMNAGLPGRSDSSPGIPYRRSHTATAPLRRSVAPSSAESFARSVQSLEPISDSEAAAFAARFALDFQSFDEALQSRRSEVLRPLLADPQASTWGWSGSGRQRADAPLPGRTFRSSELVVFVEVVVRVTTYARACPPAATTDPGTAGPYVEPDSRSLVGPSSAPPAADGGWTAGRSWWVRMTVPVTRHPDDGRLVVDPHLVPDSAP